MQAVTHCRREAGSLFGRPTRRRRLNGLVIAEALHPPSLAIARHDHAQAGYCHAITGGYEESLGRRYRRCEARMTIVHPAGEHHADRHDPVPSRLVSVELDAGRLAMIGESTRIFEESSDMRSTSLMTLAHALRREIRNDDSVSPLSIEGIVLI